MLLRKTLSLSDVNLKMEEGSLRFSGYASVFGGVDSHGDTIIAGAFASTLRKHGKPKMFLEHAWALSMTPTLPIGLYPVVKEDEKGLYVEGELTPGMSLANDVGAAMRHGTIDGLSIGGLVKKGDYDETETGRVIRKWSRLIEISVVAMPADSSARISSVKAEDLDAVLAEIETIRDFERFLRDAGGLSKGAAERLVARAKVVFARGEPGVDDAEAKQLAAIAERVKRLAGVA